MIKKTVTALSIFGILAMTSITANAALKVQVGEIDGSIPKAKNSSYTTGYVRKLHSYKVPIIVNMKDTDGETLNYYMVNSEGNQRSNTGSVNDSNNKRTTAACYSQVKTGHQYKLKLTRSSSNWFFSTPVEGTWSPDDKYSNNR